MKKGPVVLTSGGMDSFLAWALFARKAKQVFVNISHSYQERELEALQAVRSAWNAHMSTSDPFAYTVVRGPALGDYTDEKTGIIPLRNASLILAAAQHGNKVIMGVLEDEINSDKHDQFFKHMQTVLNYSNQGQYWNNGVGVTYEVTSPLRAFTKSRLIQLYLHRGHAIEPLLETVSCYSGGDVHCGACPSCFKRWVAMKNNGIANETKYKVHPLRYANDIGIIKKAVNGEYGASRAAEILKAVGE